MKAFPHTFDQTQKDGRVATVTQFGMDLRDYFAGLAMQGEIASQDSGSWDDIDRLAQYAYCVANAMMKARDDNNE